MSEPIIRVENLGKKYSIRHEHPERYTALRDVLAQRARKLFSFPKHLRPNPPVSDYEDFWALKDLNFEIQQGDRVGIIGRNGAGKSTLLKILSRITEPTTGRIELNGRVASLLEVGTGFHPELTGRENIFLNGAILGMSRQEIKSKFDEIVDFSGVEKFLDTPVKRYSSGMYVRLAFAVAAHLDPEILVVDEVLAVGDAEFQKKCLGKMEEVSMQEGKTVLFVSHNMHSIGELTNRCILLSNGMLTAAGPTTDIIQGYLNQKYTSNSNIEWKDENQAPGTEKVKLLGVSIINIDGQINDLFSCIEKIGIKIKYKVTQCNTIVWCGFKLHNNQGLNIFDSHNVTNNLYHTKHNKGEYTQIAWIPEHLLNEGQYTVTIALFNFIENIIYCNEREILNFQTSDLTESENQTAKGKYVGSFPGIVRPLLQWE